MLLLTGKVNVSDRFQTTRQLYQRRKDVVNILSANIGLNQKVKLSKFRTRN